MTFASLDFIIFFIVVLGITAIIKRRLSSKWKEVFFLSAPENIRSGIENT